MEPCLKVRIASEIKQKTMQKLPVITKSTIARNTRPLSIGVKFQFSPPLHRGHWNSTVYQIQSSKGRAWTRRPMWSLTASIEIHKEWVRSIKRCSSTSSLISMHVCCDFPRKINSFVDTLIIFLVMLYVSRSFSSVRILIVLILYIILNETLQRRWF